MKTSHKNTFDSRKPGFEKLNKKNSDKITKRITTFLLTTLVILVIASITNAIINHTLEEVFYESYYRIGSMSSLIFFGSYVAAVGRHWKGKMIVVYLFFSGFLSIIIGYFFGLLLYLFKLLIIDGYNFIGDSSLTKNEVVVIVMLVTLFGGTLLFFFRLKYRSTYGLTETFVGLYVAANRVLSESDIQQTYSSTFFVAILTAGIYLVVRGFDNIHQGITKEPYDPIAQKLIKEFQFIIVRARIRNINNIRKLKEEIEQNQKNK